MPKPTAFGKFLREMAPVALQIITQMLLQNVAGFQAFILRIVLKYGGRAALNAINEIVFQHDRKAEQEAAKAEKDKVVSNPDSTPEQVGEAYEDYYNSGRH
jgi:hypothetical protein